MAIDFNHAPACCQQSVGRIHDIVDSAGCLEEFLAAAPSIVQPRVRISALSAIWNLGKGMWSWRKLRKTTSKLLAPIVRNRVTQVADFEILAHDNEPELRKQWEALRKEFDA